MDYLEWTDKMIGFECLNTRTGESIPKYQAFHLIGHIYDQVKAGKHEKYKIRQKKDWTQGMINDIMRHRTKNLAV